MYAPKIEYSFTSLHTTVYTSLMQKFHFSLFILNTNFDLFEAFATLKIFISRFLFSSSSKFNNEKF